MPNRTLDRVLRGEYLVDLDSMPIAELRDKRNECQALEDAASYLRRLVQARLDIIGLELRARATGAESDLTALVEQLPTILAERVTPAAGGRLLSRLFPDDAQEAWAEGRVEAVCQGFDIESVPELSNDELLVLAERLGGLERLVSEERRTLHEVIDRLQAELVRRYKSGEASVEGLLT